MPCLSDYLEPNSYEKSIKETIENLLFLYSKENLNKPIKKELLKASTEIYFSKEKGDKWVSELCEQLSNLSEDNLNTIVYNPKLKKSRKLADWWEEHQEADAKRIKIETEVKTTTSLEDIYEEVKQLDSVDSCSISEAVCKFVEESGELIREINKTTGRKVLQEPLEEVHKNIKEELADTLQNLFVICNRFNIPLESLLSEVSNKNKKWELQIGKRKSIKEYPW